MYNIKGFSSIVQVTILAALSVISLALVFGYVKDLSNDLDNQLSPAVDCLSQQSKVINACIQDNKITVNLDVGLGESIDNIELSLNQESFTCGGNSCQSCSISGIGKQTIYLNPNIPFSDGDNLIFKINNCAPEQVSLTTCS